jgi:O-antigen/teichoic acid export membrane protein
MAIEDLAHRADAEVSTLSVQTLLPKAKVLLLKLGDRSLVVSSIGAIDQVSLAVTHFALTVMVARALGVDALGQFTFSYALIVLAYMAHSALLGESIGTSPTVVVAVKHRGLQAILSPTACLAGLLALLVQPLGLGSTHHALSGGPFLSALVGSLFYWTAKSYFYKLHAPTRALLLTLTYAIGTLLCFIALPLFAESPRFTESYERGLIAIAVGAGGAFAVALVLWSGKSYKLALFRGKHWVRNEDTRQVWHDVFQYGKWSMPATFLIWLANNGYYIVMPMFGQNEGAAGLRAALMIMLPVNTLIVGASVAILPMLAEKIQSNGFRSMQRMLHQVAGLGAAAALAVGIVLMANSELVMRSIYGSAFTQYAPLLQITAILPGLWAACAVYRTAIRATRRSFDVFRVYAVAMIPVGLTLMVIFSYFGVPYAAWGVVITQVLIFAAFLRSARRVSREA